MATRSAASASASSVKRTPMPSPLAKATTPRALRSSALGRRKESDTSAPTGWGFWQRTKAPPWERFST